MDPTETMMSIISLRNIEIWHNGDPLELQLGSGASVYISYT